MAESTTLTIRVTQETKDRLEKLSEMHQRSKSYLAAEAIELYIKQQEWLTAKVAAARRSGNASEAEVNTFFAQWQR